MRIARGAGRASLRRRLGIGLALGVAATWLAASVVAGLVLRHEIDEVFDSALQEVAQRVLPLAYAEVLAREDGTASQLMPPVGRHREYIAYVVRDADGRDLLRSSDADRMGIPGGLAPGFRTLSGLRTYTETGVRGTIAVTAAERLDHRRDAVAKAMMTLVGPLAALVPLALAAVWLVVRLSLGPVLAFRDAIEARGRGNLSPIATLDLPAEVAPVAAAVNALLGRLRGALEAERSFTANSAHELRTPIAAALAQTQRLCAELQDGERLARARAVEGALHRLSRLSEKLLQLAKAEGGGLIAETAAPLAPVLHLVVDELRRGGGGERLRVEAAPGPGPTSDLDPDAFAILARNLIENALKHGDPARPVSVRLSGQALAVSNAGPPVPPEDLARLTRPFTRGPARTEGSGLGLAIAAAICRGAGLRLDLASPIPGESGGFRAVVHLAPAGPRPAAPPA
ncbi:integral membrane sensor signal transduction histidine kinase [Methylobacterium sp. 4-46]|uniref:sensor histidine kinase n=1 Tax=unclassified Methylobacterium TaxID=2615210 RepID=UPI000165CAA0|nr:MULTISPECIES: ATP-binding protein [unclassified Methylobacterium]ACA16101.1 integral membrane sensor signal transduction histidine kinase [Methylobacterium sp. 4-46]